MKRCKANTHAGKRCQAPAIEGTDFCFWHSANKREALKEAQRRGAMTRNQGRATIEGQDLPLESAEDVKRALARIVNECRSGRLDYRVSNACFVGLSAFLKALDQVDVEAELAALRAEIETMKGLRVTG